jgi:hypothetical protein
VRRSVGGLAYLGWLYHSAMYHHVAQNQLKSPISLTLQALGFSFVHVELYCRLQPIVTGYN